ncbi:MAG: DNA mismatch repair protein MutS [Bacteroidetes bacterium]|nr:DNA mismatch repair protein MutS [Bacteroidota bacterium]
MSKEKRDQKETPLMRQYQAIKAKYPDAILLFRVGDFYETFGEDAIKTSGVLGIVLTRRANGAASYVELAGFPYHALDTYLPKLVKAGYRVAICDQLEDPKLAKTIVKRGVTELVTPGVSYHDKILENKENNFLACLHLDSNLAGVAFLDVSTGEFYLAQGNLDYIEKLIQSFQPSEVIIQKNKREKFQELFGNRFYISTFDDWVFTTDFARELLLKHFETTSLKGFGVEEMTQAVIAAGATLHYLAETQHDRVRHICKLSRIEETQNVWLDRFTIRNLELLSSFEQQAPTLLRVLDQTVTPMGARLLRRWIILPLKQIQPLEERLNITHFFIDNQDVASAIHQHLQAIGDLERLISKAAIGRINPREILQLHRALSHTDEVRKLISELGVEGLSSAAEQLNGCPLIRERIEREISPDAPAVVAKGNVIREGLNQELDDLRRMAFSGKDYLVQVQQREIERTGITSLKIGYNNIFGYYLEVTNPHKDKVPPEWQRKQTLVNAERYITEELREYETKILGAEEKIFALETRLFDDLVLALGEYIQVIQLNAQVLSRLDVLLSFSKVAIINRFCRPEINESYILDIKGGRHPVIEQQMKPGEEYIANDVYLDDHDQQILIITGPNMSGKSALLRQTALIVLMAQIGSFVPAKSAGIGIVDKIFTRVGASDNITSGESTFMVEMNETASILNNISNRSLILLDEIGRGTSTYDGISIAWAISEYLHNNPIYRPKVLFATHYHELNEMASTHKRIKNYHISVREAGNKVIFLRKLQPGGSEHSFGIHVAKMAGIPSSIIERANDLLVKLEQGHSSQVLAERKPERKKKQDHQTLDGFQLSFIQLDDPLLLQIKEDILNTDINTLTPVEALMKLNEIKRLLDKQ